MLSFGKGLRRAASPASLLFACLLACEGDHGRAPTSSNGGPTTGSNAAPIATAKTFRVCPGPDAQRETMIAFFDSREGDTIEFCAGQFEFTTSLLLTGKRGITIRGAGRDATILSFANSDGQDGVNINRVDGITIESLTIYDAPGNGLRVFKSDFVTIRNVKVGWSNADPASPNFVFNPTKWGENGAYAFYPVLCRHVLIEDSVSIGSSDAGVYVGQSSDILVRRTEAFHNVAGFEFENTYRAEFIDNVAHDNVGGFLVFDLPGRAQFGEKNKVHRNKSYRNNIPSFAPRGAIVGSIPSGTGMLVLASDQLEVFDNEIRDNKTIGLAIVNYGLADANESSTRYDFYPEGIHIYDNTFIDNGTSPALPDLSRSSCKGVPGLPPGLPGPTEDIMCITDNPSLLPLILMVKNVGRSAQIIWDGGVDSPNGCKDVPVDRDGIPLTQPNPNETDRDEPRADERGRPNLYLYDPSPSCKYNAWKFDERRQLKKPANGICIENNTFRQTTLLGALVPPFANVHFSSTDLTDPANLQLADNTPPTDCPLPAPPDSLASYEPDLGSFTPDPSSDPHPSDAEVAALCVTPPAGEVNFEALGRVNCPRLEHYGLFANAEDPRRDPNGSGVPFDLNTILFSDYAVKYRFLYLPPDGAGGVQKATYQDRSDCDTFNIYDCNTATLGFPVGTVFAKTFAFRNGADEDVVETRLLIKRQAANGAIGWIGIPYLWKTDASGQRFAELLIEGGTKSVSYDYDDPDPDVKDASGNVLHYGPAAVPQYQIPSAAACVLCHGGDDREAGAAPIGPKVRNLNRDADFPGVGRMNQLTFLQQQGLLDLPAPPDGLEKMARFAVPGSSGEAPNSPADVHRRVRAYLEVNCMHCHNPAGAAQNSGLSLDEAQEPMNESHGICKPPIAAGRAADIGNYDIQPGSASQSILASRIESTQPGIRMPPLARTVAQNEAVELVNHWIDSVVADFADDAANHCSGGGLGLPLAKAAH